MTNSADLDQLASSSEANIWIYTVYKGRTYPDSAGLGLTSSLVVKILNALVRAITNSQGDTFCNFLFAFLCTQPLESVRFSVRAVVSG